MFEILRLEEESCDRTGLRGAESGGCPPLSAPGFITRGLPSDLAGSAGDHYAAFPFFVSAGATAYVWMLRNIARRTPACEEAGARVGSRERPDNDQYWRALRGPGDGRALRSAGRNPDGQDRNPFHYGGRCRHRDGFQMQPIDGRRLPPVAGNTSWIGGIDGFQLGKCDGSNCTAAPAAYEIDGRYLLGAQPVPT